MKHMYIIMERAWYDFHFTGYNLSLEPQLESSKDDLIKKVGICEQFFLSSLVIYAVTVELSTFSESIG